MTATRPRRSPAARTARWPLPESASGWLGVGLSAVAVLAACVGARLTQSADVDGYGIIRALPPLYWTGIVVGAVATSLVALAVVAGQRQLGWLIPSVWLVLFHLAPQLAHAHARFSIVYVHMGFIRLIDTQHTGDVLVDARFAWPGFFGAFLSSLAPMSQGLLEIVMRLWPAAITGASASLVAALARRSYPTQPLIGPVSALVFILASWTGQDYFSPQSVGFFFYLSIIVVVEAGPLRARGAWSSVAPFLSRFATAGGDRTEARGVPSYVALIVLCFAAVVSHPLAPFFICAGLAMLGLYGRRVAWRLMLLVVVGYAIWVLVAAQPWWSTQLEDLKQQFGSISNVATASVERGAVPSAAHAFVLRVRTFFGLVVFVGTFVMGMVMATKRFSHLRPTLPLAPLAGIPVVAAGIQSYGGEMIIRVFLFTLPMASILFARVLLTIPRRALPISLAAMVAGVTPIFLLARFGNEAFEMTTEADWQAVEVLYANAEPGTLIIADNSFLPWGDRGREHQSLEPRYSVAQTSARWLQGLRGQAPLEIQGGGHDEFIEVETSQEPYLSDKVLVVFTPSQSAWLEHVEGEPARKLDVVGAWMAQQPGVTVLYQNAGAWVFQVKP